MTSVWSIIRDSVDYIGGFFEYIFIPPFIREWDQQLQRETKLRERSQLLEKVEAAKNHTTMTINSYETQSAQDCVKLHELSNRIGVIERDIDIATAQGVTQRDLGLLQINLDQLKHEFLTRTIRHKGRAQLISKHLITLNQLSANSDILATAEVSDDLLLDNNVLGELLNTIRTKTSEQSLQQTVQILGSIYLNGDTVTEANILTQGELYNV